MSVLTRRRAVGMVDMAAIGGGACSADYDEGSEQSAATTAASAAPSSEAAPDTTAATETTAAPAPSGGGEMLAAVQDAGSVRCGTRDALPGFAVLEPSGDHVGFDADFCRVIAAAVLGDAT